MKLSAEYGVTLPIFASPRPYPWLYAGWISNEAPEIYERAVGRGSDHGETREWDTYPQGWVAWVREPQHEQQGE